MTIGVASGNGSYLSLPITASTLTVPACTCPATPAAPDVTLPCTRPPSTATSPSPPPPVNGTGTIFTPAALLICWITSSTMVPRPETDSRILPGLARASAMKSWKVFHGASLFTTMIEGSSTSLMIGW